MNHVKFAPRVLAMGLLAASALSIPAFAAPADGSYTAIRVDRDPAARAAEGDGLCLLELQDPEAALERADRLVLYRWGRHYPADRRLDLPPAGWRLEEQTEFPGRSHDMITKEIYVK